MAGRSGLDHLLLAADGGGSKTRLCLLTRKGVLAAEVSVAGVATANEGALPVRDILRGACGRLLKDAGIPPGRVDGGYFSLGGPNIGEIESALREIFPGAAIRIDREANGNWLAVCAPVLGIDAVVMAGTGSVAVGLSDKEMVTTGGWGPVLDDAGSGYAIGLAAIRAALRMVDGRTPRTPLLEILRTFGCEPATGLDFAARMRLRKPLLSLSRREIAGLAPAVFQRARSGDASASAILRQASEDLAGLAASVACPGARVLGMGGVFASGESFTARCAEALKRRRPDAAFVFRTDFDLLKAACIMALARAERPLTEAILRKLKLKTEKE